METTEKIVEAYVRYVKGWATIPNLRCANQKEIDLFAIDPLTDDRWHIETSVSISGGFSALTSAPFEHGEHKHRVKQAGARRKLGFFLAEKFEPEAVSTKLAEYGCVSGKVRRAIVTWDWKPGVQLEAKKLGIELWSFPELMEEIAELGAKERAYFGDDTLRTIMLFVKGANAQAKRQSVRPVIEASANRNVHSLSEETGGRFYVYENWTHKRARLHRSDCSHCNDGRGTQASSGTANGRWLGPFETRQAAEQKLSRLPYADKGACAVCVDHRRN